MAGTGLSAASILSLVRTTQTKYMKNKWVGTQNLTKYSLFQEFSGLKSESFGGTKYGWKVYMTPNDGAVRGTRLYSASAATKGMPPVEANVPIVLKEAKGIVFDYREIALNNDPEAKIVSEYEVQREAVNEAIANHLENDLAFGTQNSTDDLSFNGLPTWGRPSWSGTAYTANTSGGFTGQRIRFRDGSSSNTLAAIDATDVNNARWRNYTHTHDGEMTPALYQKLVAIAQDETYFTPYPMRKGDGYVGDCVLFMGDSFYATLRNIVNNGPDDRGRGGNKANVMPFTEFEVGPMRVCRAPILNGHALNNPVWGVRLGAFEWRKLDGFWMKELPAIDKGASDAHNTAYIPIDICGQLICKNPREGIFLSHGSF